MTAAVDPVLAEHARSLLKLARLFDAIGASDSFTRLARDWPYPGERATTPEDDAWSVRRFHAQVERAYRPLRVGAPEARFEESES